MRPVPRGGRECRVRHGESWPSEAATRARGGDERRDENGGGRGNMRLRRIIGIPSVLNRCRRASLPWFSKLVAHVTTQEGSAAVPQMCKIIVARAPQFGHPTGEDRINDGGGVLTGVPPSRKHESAAAGRHPGRGWAGAAAGRRGLGQDARDYASHRVPD